jgi:hypothetical protein
MADSTVPSLVESNVKYAISESLKQAHTYKMKTYSFFFNLGIVVLFFLVFGGVLYYRYKTKPTPQEAHEKMIKDQAIIMSKIHQHQDDRQRSKYSGMTKMPFVDTDYYVSSRPDTS